MTLIGKESKSFQNRLILYMLMNGFSCHNITPEAMSKNIHTTFNNLSPKEQLEYVLLSKEVLYFLHGEESLSADMKKYLTCAGFDRMSQILGAHTALVLNKRQKEEQVIKSVKNTQIKYPLEEIVILDAVLEGKDGFLYELFD